MGVPTFHLFLLLVQLGELHAQLSCLDARMPAEARIGGTGLNISERFGEQVFQGIG